MSCDPSISHRPNGPIRLRAHDLDTAIQFALDAADGGCVTQVWFSRCGVVCLAIKPDGMQYRMKLDRPFEPDEELQLQRMVTRLGERILAALEQGGRVGSLVRLMPGYPGEAAPYQ